MAEEQFFFDMRIKRFDDKKDQKCYVETEDTQTDKHFKINNV